MYPVLCNRPGLGWSGCCDKQRETTTMDRKQDKDEPEAKAPENARTQTTFSLFPIPNQAKPHWPDTNTVEAPGDGKGSWIAL